jgi:thymidine phosphorylase
LAKMNTIIQAQGQNQFDHNAPTLGTLTHEVTATEAGVVTGIDNLQIARIARLAGAPKVVSAGVDLFHKLGDSVSAGDVLYRVHAEYQSDLEFSRQACAKFSGFTIGNVSDLPHVFVEF